MEFEEHKPIYLQISDFVCNKILLYEWKEEKRIPSVRELSARLGVNPNTIIKSYDYLESRKLIRNKRGSGFYVDTGAVNIIKNENKAFFMEHIVPNLFSQLEILQIDMIEIVTLHERFKSKKNSQ